MKRHILSVVAAGLALTLVTGCMKDDTSDVVVSGGKTQISAGISETRTSIGELVDGSRKVYWSNGDQIAVNGTASAALENLGEQTGTAVFTFDGVLSTPYNALYPASIWTDASTVTLPASQTHVDGSFGQNASPMATYAADESELPMQFHHLCAVVKLTITPDADTDEISYIEFRGNASEQVSGAFAIDYQSAALTPASDAEADKSVRLNVNRTLSADADNEFFVVVPEGEYSQGFTVKVVDVRGHYMEKSTTSSKTLVAGQINAMPAFAFVPTDTELGVEISSAEQLVAFAKAYNNKEYADVSPLLVTLTDDIVFDDQTNADLEAIGCVLEGGETNYFNGSFNGNGKTIKNWVVKSPLFDYVGGAGIVTDLTIDASCTFAFDLTDGSVNYTSIVGYHKGLLQNCHNNADIVIDNTEITEGINVGGLAGRVVEGTIDGCTMNGKMSFGTGFSTSNDINVGGIAAYNSNAEGVIKNSTLNGSIDWQGSVTNGKRICLGGIAGRITGRVEYCTVAADGDNSVINTFGDNTYTTALGGMVGVVNEGASIDNCTNNGRITTKMQRINSEGTNDASRYEYIGGIAGLSDGSVINCSNTAFTQTRSSMKTISIGGVVGYSREGSTVSGCTNSGNVTARTSGASPFGGRYLTFGGVIGSSAGTVSDISNSGPLEVSRMDNYSSSSLAFGGCIGQSSSDIDGKGMIVNTGEVVSNLFSSDCSYYAQGGVIGYATASVSGVENRGAVTFTLSGILANTNTGGVLGMSSGTAITIADCRNSGDVTRSNDESNVSKNSGNALGGIVGGIRGVASRVENCTNTGTIRQGIWNNNLTANIATTAGIAGGIVGAIVGAGDSNRAEIVNCEASEGTIYGKRGFLGGIAGYAEFADISNSRNYMSTDSNIAAYTSGIAAYMVSSSVDGCTCKASLNSTSGTPFLGGIAAFVDGASKVTDSKYYGSLVSGVAALVSGGVAAQTESGAAISGCGFGGTIEGAAMTEADVCGDTNGTFTDNYIWDGQE